MIKLAYQTSLPPPEYGSNAIPDRRRHTCIILLHGFSGSSEYFEKNFAALSADHWVVAPDLRGHGQSGRPSGGYHVARLAADLRDLLAHLRQQTAAETDAGHHGVSIRFVPVGCSLGAAVLWTYAELFGRGDTCDDFAGCVFVDQAPLQDLSPFGASEQYGDGPWEKSKAHLGCYDEATMRAAQELWTRDPPTAHADLVAGCLGYRVAPEPDRDDLSAERRAADEQFFTRISAQCDPVWLARLLADHTRYDHREAIDEHFMTLPTLVLAGRRTGCFPIEGIRETVRRVERRRPSLESAAFQLFDSGHWLFYEEPERFNEVILSFIRNCTSFKTST
ncbi:hypothetical protein SLS62_009600 [Diatrype stigma]|uniref:AB hydrolase-1 domain-containing protein n=1 Tax=Diatrype stigma TaxID=117547 RepID=A0AAN9YKU6_9PEZI